MTTTADELLSERVDAGLSAHDRGEVAVQYWTASISLPNPDAGPPRVEEIRIRVRGRSSGSSEGSCLDRGTSANPGGELMAEVEFHPVAIEEARAADGHR